MRALVLLAALWAMTGAAAAGPWLREEGAVFLSFGQNLALSDGAEPPVKVDPSLYVEWGARERLTLALAAHTGDAQREVALEFRGITDIRLPEDRPDRVTVSFGLGARQVDGTEGTQPLVLAGAAWGRGLPAGWLAAEALLSLEAVSGNLSGKVDVTWGHRFSERLSGYLQLTVGEGHTGDRYAKIAPNVVWKLGARTSVTAGVVQALTGDRGTGLSLGTWVEF